MPDTIVRSGALLRLLSPARGAVQAKFLSFFTVNSFLWLVEFRISITPRTASAALSGLRGGDGGGETGKEGGESRREGGRGRDGGWKAGRGEGEAPWR